MTAWTAEEAARELLAVLPFLNRMITAELHEEVGEETTMPQFRVLGYLNDKPQTLSAIARQRRLTPFMQQLTETEMDAVRLALPVLHRALSGEPEHDR